MSEIRYQKITLVDGTRFILRITSETPRFVNGIEVDSDGEEVVPRGADAQGRRYHQRERHVERGTIKKTVPLRMNTTYATLEPPPPGSSHARKKSAAQLDAEIATTLRAHAKRKAIPNAVKTTIAEHATEFIEGAYRRHATIGGKEPCLSVGLITDYLRQAHMPEDFRYAPKNQQRTWTRSVLESMRRRGQIGSSFAATSRCYEPKR